MKLSYYNEGGIYTTFEETNEDLIAPIRAWLVEHSIGLDTLRRAYSPDTIQWKDDLKFNGRNITIGELKKLEKYAVDLYEK